MDELSKSTLVGCHQNPEKLFDRQIIDSEELESVVAILCATNCAGSLP